MKYSLIKRFSFALFTVAILTAIPTLSFGQWIIGLKAGYVKSKLSGGDVYGSMSYNPIIFKSNDNAGIGTKGGVEAGVVISKKLKVDFAFESGIFYSMGGFNQKFNLDTKETYYHPTTNARITIDSLFRYDNSLSLNYLKVPLMLRKSFSIKGSNLYPYKRKISSLDIDIMFGPYFAYLISSSSSFDTKVSVKQIEDGEVKSTVPESGINDPYHQSFKIGQGVTIISTDPTTIPITDVKNLPARASLSDGLSKIDVGIVAALGFSIELSPEMKLMFGGNYSMGLLSIDKEYFSDLTYTVSPGGSFDIGGGTMATVTKTVSKKMDLKNSSLGAYVGFVMYLKR